MKSLKNISLLYVEDEEETRSATASLLQRLCDDLYVAKDGEEGLKVFKDKNPDIVITDIQMPKMNGIEMSKYIKTIDPERPIIIITAFTDTSYLRESIELHIEDYICKPISVKTLKEKIEKIKKNIQTKKDLAGKTHELEELNKNLQNQVEQKLKEIREKDNILLQQSKDAAMGEMIDAVAHQWKAPLGIMKLYAQDTISICEDPSQDELAQAIENSEGILTNIDHLINTLEEFRSFFRPENKLQKVDLKNIIKSTSILLKDELVKNTIQLETDIQNGAVCEIIPNQFKHVLINLISNAKDQFIKKEILNRKITITSQTRNDRITLKIFDNAGGIEESLLERIFDKNFSTKQDIGGTGIGLYMVKQILDKIDADIKALNYENGACFCIDIPI